MVEIDVMASLYVREAIWLFSAGKVVLYLFAVYVEPAVSSINFRVLVEILMRGLHQGSDLYWASDDTRIVH